MPANDQLVRCTQRVREALLLARAEAARQGVAAVGPAHVLLGLAWERGGVAARALDGLGLTPTRLRAALVAGPGAPSLAPTAPTGLLARLRERFASPPPIDRAQPVTAAGLSPVVVTLLRQAQADAERRDRGGLDTFIGTEHLLLALMAEHTLATTLVEALGRHPEEVRAAVFAHLDQATRRAPRI